MTRRAIVQTTVPSVIALLVWVGVAGLTNVLSSDAERHLAAEDERSLMLEELAEARDLSGQVPGVAARLTATGVAVPPTLDLAAFVRAVDGAGDRVKVFIEQMAPLTVSSDTDEDVVTQLPVGTSAVSISIGASGGYEEVMAFADELLTMNRLVVIDLLEVNTDEEDTSRVIADFELRLFTTDRLTTVDADSEDFDAAVDDEDDVGDDDEEAMSEIGGGL